MPRSRHSQPVYEPPLSLGAWEPKARRRLLPAKAGCVAPPLRQPAKRGFTIVEVMMAAVILMVGFMGMVSVMTVSSGMMDHARRQTLADQILTQEIEELRLATWTTISNLPTASTSVAIDSQFSAAVAASGATYTVTRTVTSPNPYTNIREINFTVTWVVATSRRDASNNPLTFTYQRTNTAWFGQYGLNLTYQRS